MSEQFPPRPFPPRPYRTERPRPTTREVYRLSDGAYVGVVWKTRGGHCAVSADGDLVLNYSVPRDAVLRCLLDRLGENEEVQ